MNPADEDLKYYMRDPKWYLIAEFSLSEADLDTILKPELTNGSLFQTMRDLGIPSEFIRRILRTIIENARRARDHFNHNSTDIPVRICFYTHKKMEDGLKRSGDQAKGGWGHYVIERGRDFSTIPWHESPRVLELYLYKEVE